MFNHLIKVLINKNNQSFNAKKVEDCIVAQIEYKNNAFSYFKNNTFFPKSPELFLREKNGFKNIVIVLESPHRNEYDEKGEPLRPAMGTAGVNLKSKLIGIMNRNGELKKVLNKETYNLWLVNAVQYQCSFGLKPIQKEMRNFVFRVLWKELKEDFLIRLKNLEPIVVINLCTGGKKVIEDILGNKNSSLSETPLNLLVHKAIKEIFDNKLLYLYGSHPSSSYFSNPKYMFNKGW